MNTGPLGKILILTGAAVIILGVVLLFIELYPVFSPGHHDSPQPGAFVNFLYHQLF
jgi:hypothetical protein